MRSLRFHSLPIWVAATAVLLLGWRQPLVALERNAADEADSILLGRVVRIERCQEHGNEGHNSMLFGYYAVLEIGQVVKGSAVKPGGAIAVRIGGYWAAIGHRDRMLPRELEGEHGGAAVDLHPNDIIVGFFAPPNPNAEAPKDLTAPTLVPDQRSGLFRISRTNLGSETLIVHPLKASAELDGLPVDEFAKRVGISWVYPPALE